VDLAVVGIDAERGQVSGAALREGPGGLGVPRASLTDRVVVLERKRQGRVEVDDRRQRRGIDGACRRKERREGGRQGGGEMQADVTFHQRRQNGTRSSDGRNTPAQAE